MSIYYFMDVPTVSHSGDAMKITKCPDMTIHEDIQCAALHKLDVQGSGILLAAVKSVPEMAGVVL